MTGELTRPRYGGLVGVASDGDHFEGGHDGAGGVSAVGGSGNQADVALGFTAMCMVSAYDQQAGKLALRAGIRLQ